MSKDIWHTVEETPEEDRVIVVKSKRTGEYLVGSEFEFILENFTKWAYFDDLLALETELERTRKTLDNTIKLAEEMLKDIEYEGLCSWQYKERLNKIKSITKGGDNVSE